MGSMESVQDSNVQRVEIPGNFADKSPRLRPKSKSGNSISETLINLLPNITGDNGTMDKRGSCQHDDEPLPHFLNDRLEDRKRSDNFFSGNLQRSGGLQKRDEGLKRSKTFNSEGLQTPNELYSHSFIDATHPPFEGTRGINPVLQKKGLQALILQISMLLKFAGNYPLVVISMGILILTQVACAAVQVPIDCMSGAVITSPDYPAMYPKFIREDWFLTTPEGRMILLTFYDFSLGYLDDVQVIDPADARNWQRYSGVENTFPPFLSSRNSLILRLTSNGNPPGNGFNISASCYELSGTRVGRFVGGNTPAEGFLELQAESGGEWKRVCEEHSADRVAEVVCRELGFPGVKEMSYKHGGCSLEGADQDCIRAPSCGKNAYRSQDCSASSEKCASSLEVKVKCFASFGFCSQTDDVMNGSWDFDATWFGSIVHLTCDDGYRLNGSGTLQCVTKVPSYLHVWNGSIPSCEMIEATVGFCNQTDEVMNGSWDSNITWFGSIVNLTCDDGYRLNGSGTLQCGTEVSSQVHVWNGSIPTCEMIEGVSTGIGAGLLAFYIILGILSLLTFCGVVIYNRQRLRQMYNKSREATRTGHSRAIRKAMKHTTSL